MVSVAIFDYGAGNIFSLKTSLEKNGANVDIITSFDQSKKYDGLLLPGVGNFDPAIRSIRDYSALGFHDFVKDKIPVLGICLGMEMFFQQSQEGKEKGLDVMNGEVVLLPNDMLNSAQYKIVDLLNIYKINAASITSDTDPNIRRLLIDKFKNKNSGLNILVNYDVLTTGFDAPKTKVAIISRPTTSIVLYHQMIVLLKSVHY